jgi:uncharacterized protein YlxP (DUF503 family)
MIVGILQVELKIDAAESLKDKRRVISSVKDRLHREHQVSVAEVASQDDMSTAVIGIAMASCDMAQCQGTLDRILDKLRQQRDCHVGAFDKQVLTGATAR